MKKYIFNSIKKFKQDALSKIIYDFIKYLFLTFGIIIILKFIPVIKDFFMKELTLSLWLYLSIILIIVIILFLFYSYRYNNVYKKLKEKSQVDDLTGIKNYKALEEALEGIFTHKTAKDLFPISLLLFDIDNFKYFNETHGYAKADLILKKLGDFFISDNRVTDQVFRYFLRGDEFLIIATKTNLANGKNAADRKRKLISENNFIIDGKTFSFTVSCGVTEISEANSKNEVLDKLNTALIKAKSNPGKNKTETIS